jgi:hypothetical protein
MESGLVRCWRTGALAVVMAALGQAGQAARGGPGEARAQSWRHSPFDVADTALRIEGSAQRRGMPVFARSLRGAGSRLIVLGSAQGGTPVLMHRDEPGRIELPLGVLVQRAQDGQADVVSGVASHWLRMPHALAQDLAELEAALGEALLA